MVENLKKHIENNTDSYFSNTKLAVSKHGDSKVVYAYFLRKPSVYAVKIALDFIIKVSNELNYDIKVHENFKEGDLVAAGEPLFFLEGSFIELSELETLILQRLGVPCLCAWNAYSMSKSLRKAFFISMIARHCVDEQMVYACEYGASVGSNLAVRGGAKGFIGCSDNASAYLFAKEYGIGTMPHSLIGYAGSTIRAAEMFYDTFAPEEMTVLVDYFGKEVSDSLEVCARFRHLAESGNLSIRLDTHGGRFLEGLSYDKSNEIIEHYVPSAFIEYKDKEEIDFLSGSGVSAAAIFYMREMLNNKGFKKVKIIVSSGFDIRKCLLMAKVDAPIDGVGTGSYIPPKWADTYATADIVSYDGRLSIKKGREFLIKKWQKKLKQLSKG